MEEILRSVGKCEAVRYLFWGGCTTAVNLLTFSALYGLCNRSVQTANVVSILTAVLFAFAVNRRFVFCRERVAARTVAVEFGRFLGARGVTLLLEMFGLAVFTDCLGMSPGNGKVFLQIVVILMNYVLSKNYVFQEKNVCER